METPPTTKDPLEEMYASLCSNPTELNNLKAKTKKFFKEKIERKSLAQYSDVEKSELAQSFVVFGLMNLLGAFAVSGLPYPSQTTRRITRSAYSFIKWGILSEFHISKLREISLTELEKAGKALTAEINPETWGKNRVFFSHFLFHSFKCFEKLSELTGENTFQPILGIKILNTAMNCAVEDDQIFHRPEYIKANLVCTENLEPDYILSIIQTLTNDLNRKNAIITNKKQTLTPLRFKYEIDILEICLNRLSSQIKNQIDISGLCAEIKNYLNSLAEIEVLNKTTRNKFEQILKSLITE